MNYPESYIKNAILISNYFGRWPDFYHSEILYIFFDRNYPREPKLFIRLYINEKVKIDDHSSIPKQAIVDVEFFALKENKIKGFNYINKVEKIKFKYKSGLINVSFNGKNGIKAIFSVEEVTIKKLKPWEEDPKHTDSTYS